MAHNHQDMAEIIVRRAADSELAELLELRREVFVREQGVPPEMEHDELDITAIHAVARSDGEVIGTGRLMLLPGPEAHIGRMAVRSGLRRQGIGGRVGAVVGHKLHSLGKDHQVLAVTHLAQLAACAEHHFRVDKDPDDRHARATVQLLQGEAERVGELAAMLGAAGDSGSDTARELLRAAATQATRSAD